MLSKVKSGEIWEMIYDDHDDIAGFFFRSLPEAFLNLLTFNVKNPRRYS